MKKATAFTLSYSQEPDRSVDFPPENEIRSPRPRLAPVAKVIQGLLLAAAAYQPAHAVTISGGATLSAASDADIGPAGEAVLLNDGVLKNTATFSTGRDFTISPAGSFTNDGDLTISGIVSGSGPLEKNGGGRLILTGNNGYSGGINSHSGIIQGTTDGLKGNILNNGSTLVYDQSFTGTYAGSVSGAGQVVKYGSGTVLLRGTSSYGASTLLINGVLDIVDDRNLGIGGDLVFYYTASTETRVLQNSAAIEMTRNIGLNADGVFRTNANLTLKGNIEAGGRLTKEGTATLFIRHANTYTGDTLISNGVLDVEQDANLGVGGKIIFDKTSSGAAATPVLQTSSAMTTNRAVQLVTAGTFRTASDLTLGGAISGAGSLVKDGAATLRLTGANTYSGGTNINGGTVIVNNVGNLGTGGMSFDNGGVLESAGNINQGGAVSLVGNGVLRTTNIMNFTGNITGSGGLTKEGTGALSLSGTNSYSGGTTVSGGSLTGTTTSLQGNIVNNATVAFNQAADGTYAGAMSGSGHLDKINNNILTLGGTNTYSGGTTVSSGGILGNTDSIQGAVTNNGAVYFNQTSDGTYSGVMDGTGTLFKNGGGNLTLTGANTYTGATVVNAGTLSGSTTSLQGNITNNGTVNFDQAVNGVFTGVIGGTGALRKSNAGTLSITKALNYSGNTTVDGGKLSIASTGSLSAASAVTVNNGAFLMGTGRVGTVSVLSGGTVAAGDVDSKTVGTLDILGNYAPAAGSKLLAYFDSTAASKINVGGSAVNIANAAIQMRAAAGAATAAGSYTLNKAYTILTSGTALTGPAPTVDSDLAFLTFTPTVAGKDLVVTISAIAGVSAGGGGGGAGAGAGAGAGGGGAPATTAFTQHATNNSQRALAVALDQNLASLPAQALLATSGVARDYALQSASGHQYGVMTQVTQDNLQQSQQTIKRQQQCQVGGADGDSPCQSFWMDAGANSFRLDADSGSSGLRANGEHLMMGIQSSPPAQGGFSGGVFFGHQKSNADFGNALGNGKATSTQVGAYGGWKGNDIYATVNMAVSQDHYKVDRQILGSGVTASSSFNGNTIGVNTEVGLAWGNWGDVRIQPFLGIGVNRIKRNGATETGAANLNLVVDGESETTTNTQLGARFEGTLGSYGAWYMQPTWTHLLGRAKSHVNVKFAADPSTGFEYNAANPRRDSLALEAGMQTPIGKNISLYAGGSLQTGNRTEAWRVSGGLKARW